MEGGKGGKEERKTRDKEMGERVEGDKYVILLEKGRERDLRKGLLEVIVEIEGGLERKEEKEFKAEEKELTKSIKEFMFITKK